MLKLHLDMGGAGMGHKVSHGTRVSRRPRGRHPKKEHPKQTCYLLQTRALLMIDSERPAERVQTARFTFFSDGTGSTPRYVTARFAAFCVLFARQPSV